MLVFFQHGCRNQRCVLRARKYGPRFKLAYFVLREKLGDSALSNYEKHGVPTLATALCGVETDLSFHLVNRGG